MRGQGSTEYLIVFAVVLVITIIVASLLGFFPSFSEGSQASANIAYWQSAKPFSITSTFQNTTGSLNRIQLDVDNNEARELTITSFSLTPITNTTAVTNTTSFVFSPGETRAIHVQTATINNLYNCTGRAGKYVSYNVNITYNDGTLTGKTQAPQKPLMVQCQS